MSEKVRRQWSLVFGTLVLAGAGLGWMWLVFEASLEREKAKTVALEAHVRALEGDIGRIRGLLEKFQAAERAESTKAKRQEIERQVESVRGLSFKQPISYNEISRQQFTEFLVKKVEEQYSDAELEAMGLALTAMGLVRDDIDIKKVLVELLGEQVGAFYDQHSHKLFMFSGADLVNNSQDRIIMAHELTHALQDQYFQLSKFPLEIKDNDDLVMATSALVEGDATLVMTYFMMQNFSLATLKDTMGAMLTQNMEKFAKAPRYLRETLTFPYLRGQEFCTALSAEGGFERISQAFRDPPKSTAQILHPEKYLRSPREDPIPVQFQNPLLNGEKPVFNNVMGEFSTRLLFSEWLDGKLAENAAAGWRGDRYLVFGKRGAASVVWKSLWSSPQEAEEFRAAVAGYLKKRYNLPADPPLKNGEPFVMDAPRFLRLVRQGNGVVLVDATTKEAAEQLLTLGES